MMRFVLMLRLNRKIDLWIWMVDDIYQTCKYISSDYDSFRFEDFKKPADEPIIALAMAVNGAKPITAPADRFCFLRNTKNLKADFFSKSLSYYFENDVNGNGKLMHFATLRTILPIYQVEKHKVDYVWEHGCKWTVETTAADILFSKGKKWCFEKIVLVGIR